MKTDEFEGTLLTFDHWGPHIGDRLAELVSIDLVLRCDLYPLSIYGSDLFTARTMLLLILIVAYRLGNSAIHLCSAGEINISSLPDGGWKIIKDLSIEIGLPLSCDDLRAWAKKNISEDDRFVVLPHDGRSIGLKKCYLLESRLSEKLSENSLFSNTSKADLTALLKSDPLVLFGHMIEGSNITLLSGGPGTGKSTWIAAWLKSLFEHNALTGTIKLTAPTARAVKRLSGLVDLVGGGDFIEAMTIHSLLGRRGVCSNHLAQRGVLSFKYLVVDEASMVDAQLLAELLNRAPEDSRIILVGDGDQLPSVELGGSFAALHEQHLRKRPLCTLSGGEEIYITDRLPPMLRLTKNHRFSSSNSIGQFAAAVRDGDYSLAMKELEDGDGTIVWFPDTCEDGVYIGLQDKIKEIYSPYFNYLNAGGSDISELERLLSSKRLLTYGNSASFGSIYLNKILLKLKGEYTSTVPLLDGVPIMAMRNISRLNIANGEIGIIVGSGGSDGRVQFRTKGDKLLSIKLDRLTEYPTSLAWASTVHKAQGSEFDEVAILMSEMDRGLSRPWLYTAATRGRKRIILFATRQLLEDAICTTGLRTNFLNITF